MQFFILMISALGASAVRYNLKPQFNDSAIIVDSSTQLRRKADSLPYYQPVQHITSYRITDNKAKQQTDNLDSSNKTSTLAPNNTAIFTQEEFPRDLLEIAQHKLGLKTLDEVPSITELAELLGTNNANETISYIRQLTATDQGIALMKSYIESSDYTDNSGNKEIETTTTTTPAPTQSISQQSFMERMAAFLNIYNVEPQHKQVMKQQFFKIAAAQQAQPMPTNIRRPLYMQNPLPYHYPIPLRPLSVNRTALRKAPGHQSMVPKFFHNTPATAPMHLNTLKALSPAHIQQLARIANVSPNKLTSFLQQKPKLADLAAKMIRFPAAQERNPLADGQLIAAVQKIMEQDEDLKKLMHSSNTLM